MIFERPMLLSFLSLPILYCFWGWLRAGHPLAMPFDHGHAPSGRALGAVVRVAEFLPGGLLAAGILLWAGPLRQGPPAQPSPVTNIQIALDTSGSMNGVFGTEIRSDGTPATRYDAAMDAIGEFTTYGAANAFGLTIFSNQHIHWVPLTRDLSAIRLAAPFLRPGSLPRWDGTAVGSALLACSQLLEERQEGDRMIIVITDGESPDLEGGNAAVIARQLQAKAIEVHAISVRDEPPAEELRTVAQMTGGAIFQAGDPQAIKAVFRHLDQLQRGRLVIGEPQWMHWYVPFALAGLVILAAHQLAALGLRFTPW